VKAAVDAMYSDGTMAKILGKWQLSSSAMKK
jgi:ABC-type amino acid transport substrate-binding protein